MVLKSTPIRTFTYSAMQYFINPFRNVMLSLYFSEAEGSNYHIYYLLPQKIIMATFDILPFAS